MGTIRGNLLVCLDSTHARLYYNATEQDMPDPWRDGDPPVNRDPEAVRKVARDYLDFAWEKANNCRGISAGRSIDHFIAWMWLSGDEDCMEGVEYRNYGKQILVAVSECLGVDWKKLDDDEWGDEEYGNKKTADEAMA